MRLCGIEFAPLNIPLSRRLQTFIVTFWVFVLFISVPICFFLPIYILFCTSYWWIVPLYLTWLIYDWKSPKTGGYPFVSMQKLSIWQHLRAYFPIEIIKTVDLSEEKNYIFGCFPHGIISFGILCNFGFPYTGFFDKFPKLKPKVMTLETNFWFPLRREFLLALGSCDVSRESIRYLLTQLGTGQALCIVVGGAEEALYARPGMNRIKINNRYGFVREAIKHGASLVPVYTFGETDLYAQLHNPEGTLLRRFQAFVKAWLGFTLPIINGRGIFNYTFGLLPYRVPLYTVVGGSIETVQEDCPSNETIQSYHTKFVAALIELFESHKTKYGIAIDAHLELE